MSVTPHDETPGQTTDTVVHTDDMTALAAWITGITPPPAPARPAAPPPPAPGRPVAVGAGTTAYGAAALAGEAAELASMGPDSGRNQQLNLAAYKLAGWIATGDLTEQAIIDALYQASISNGSVKDHGDRSVRATIRSGLSAGRSAPRAKGALEVAPSAPVTLLPPPPGPAAPAAGEPADGDAPAPAQVDSAEQPPAPAEKRPGIDVSGGDAAAVRALHDAIEQGIVPDLYVTNGQIVRLEQISGDVATSQTGGAPVQSAVLGPDGMASLLARRTFTYRTAKDEKTGKIRVAETVPAVRILAATLADRHWPTVRPLHGIATTPVLRPDGSLLQAPGYDQVTGLFHAPKIKMPDIPTTPSAEEVAVSRAFLLDELLSGFPWVEWADCANYIGLLISQILRPFLGGALVPFGLIVATTASSGKSLLTELAGALYGSRIVTWPRGDDAELRKAITAVLDTAAAVVVWDNLREGAVLDAPVLAQLITAPIWSDRQLGTNKTVSMANDRLWLATGNNLRLGGDMATRSVLVRLDPKMAHPEERTGFKIPHLDQWIRQPDAQRTVLYHLLVLVADWIAAGAPRSGQVMRQFTGWAQAIGGLLDHHAIPGFLGNVDAIRAMDDDDNEWAIFLTKWHEIHGDKPLTAAELRRSADVDFTPFTGAVDRWEGAFLADGRTGQPVNAKSLGRRLAGQVGRFHGDYVLRRGVISHGPVTIWSVHRTDTTQ